MPINFTSHSINGDYICNATEPYYTFFCTLYGTDLLWYFNEKLISSFLGSDEPSRSYISNYPDSPEKPVYNVTTVLTDVDYESVRYYNVPFCISTLTVQPFDHNDFTVIPFSVSCRTHCLDRDTQICQTKDFKIAGESIDNNSSSYEIR